MLTICASTSHKSRRRKVPRSGSVGLNSNGQRPGPVASPELRLEYSLSMTIRR